MNKKVKISYQDETIELPIVIGSENEQAVDISKLRSQTGLITLDRGFKNTGSTSSSITFLDGERGILRYRGYSIEELAQYSSFLEVSYLLINGQLPTVDQLNTFKSEITNHTLVAEDVRSILDGFRQELTPWVYCALLFLHLQHFILNL